eukprot:9242955-Ditylum_brightwellii.AAC.1
MEYSSSEPSRKKVCVSKRETECKTSASKTVFTPKKKAVSSPSKTASTPKKKAATSPYKIDSTQKKKVVTPPLKNAAPQTTNAVPRVVVRKSTKS